MEINHIFIDANIFLDFFRLGNEDLNKLNELIEQIDLGHLKIYLTKQTYDEFFRNREVIFKQTYKDFLDSKIEIRMNSIFKNYPEYKKLVLLQRALEKLKSDLGEKVQNEMEARTLVADNIIRKIFDKSGIIDSDKYLDKAIIRHKLGNPPGKKNNSYGDEIIWETLLDIVPQETKFVVISNDGDYESPMFENKLHSFLIAEWRKAKKSNIYLYKNLGQFFKEHNIAIDFENEKNKNELVEALINSKSFVSTHEIIRRLSQYNSFSNEQIQGLGTALLGNQQVNAIIEDKDVRSFYKDNLIGRFDVFDDDSWSEIESYIFVEKVEINKEISDIIESINDSDLNINLDDIPF